MRKALLFVEKKSRILLLLCLCFLCPLINASGSNLLQGIKVGGVVKTAVDDQPLPGVNVIEKGTQNGTITDLNGRFSITVSNADAVLVFSFMGYLSEEVAVNGNSLVNITMIEDFEEISEVVVVGYGVQKKSDVTGSIAQVSSDQIQNVASPQIASALQGKASGVYISNKTGKAGGEVDIRIRGITSLNDIKPLWIIDGVPGDPLLVNMNDIETIDIIKDGTAAAIYGVKAAAGVILVTTKRGIGQKKPKISFNAYTGISEPWRLPEMISSDEYITLKNEQWGASVPWGLSLDSLGRYPTTNWMKEMYKTGKSQNYDLSISGSNETTNYYIGLTHFNEEPGFIDNSYKKYSLRLNSDYKINNWLKIGESLNLLASNLNPVHDEDRYIRDLFRTPPMMPVFDEKNQPGGYGYVDYLSIGDFDGGNPYATQMTSIENKYKQKIGGNAYATVSILPSLKVTTTFAGSYTFDDSKRIQLPYNLGVRKKDFPTTDIYMAFEKQWDMLGNIYANYDKTLGVHGINITAGMEASKSEGIKLEGSGQDASFNLFVLDQTELENRKASGNEKWGRSLSQFGRVTYTYSNKYVLQGIVRRDGSDKFGSNNKYGIFPSVSAAWKLSEESFIRNIESISFLKVRGGFGINGNDNIDQYLYSPYYVSANAYPYGVYSNARTYKAVRISERMHNPDIQWERSKQTDMGLELGLFKNQLFIVAEAYQKTMDKMLFYRSLPFSSGLGQQYKDKQEQVVNAGSVRNRGIDLSTTYKGNVGEFKFSLTGNISMFRYTVEELIDNLPLISNNVLEGQTPVSMTTVGEPGGYFFGYQVDGIFQTQEQVDEYNNRAKEIALRENPNLTEFQLADVLYHKIGTAPGDLIFRDISGDGKITSADREQLGHPWPKAVYGLNIMASYKWFDLLISASGVYKVDVFNESRILTHQFAAKDYSTSSAALERWTQEKPSQTNYRINGDDPNKNMDYPSSWYIEDGSFLRFKNIQLGFTVPSSLSNRIRIENFRIYVSGQNLFTFTNYSGFDPEIGIGSATGAGVDKGVYPQSKIILFGLQIDL